MHSTAPAEDTERRAGRLADRTRHRHPQVHQLIAQGHDLRAIARELGLARNTVRRFARTSNPDELLVNNGTGKRPRAVEEFAVHLRRCWEQCCTNAEQLYLASRTNPRKRIGSASAALSSRGAVAAFAGFLRLQPVPAADQFGHGGGQEVEPLLTGQPAHRADPERPAVHRVPAVHPGREVHAVAYADHPLLGYPHPSRSRTVISLETATTAVFA
ncbi:helix-turn-helix domain-containing protein [Sphaerisporangium sp. B11E5]|uniref:helix-turn-helix domain-containing protein n=1 Tax=Sphaerisporangium sp. B11E5 TaxID=3153563 RepID=UPI00325E23F7